MSEPKRIRVTEQRYHEVQPVLKAMGLSVPKAIDMFLQNVATTKSLGFTKRPNVDNENEAIILDLIDLIEIKNETKFLEKWQQVVKEHQKYWSQFYCDGKYQSSTAIIDGSRLNTIFLEIAALAFPNDYSITSLTSFDTLDGDLLDELTTRSMELELPAPIKPTEVSKEWLELDHRYDSIRQCMHYILLTVLLYQVNEAVSPIELNPIEDEPHGLTRLNPSVLTQLIHYGLKMYFKFTRNGDEIATTFYRLEHEEQVPQLTFSNVHKLLQQAYAMNQRVYNFDFTRKLEEIVLALTIPQHECLAIIPHKIIDNVEIQHELFDVSQDDTWEEIYHVMRMAATTDDYVAGRVPHSYRIALQLALQAYPNADYDVLMNTDFVLVLQLLIFLKFKDQPELNTIQIASELESDLLELEINLACPDKYQQMFKNWVSEIPAQNREWVTTWLQNLDNKKLYQDIQTVASVNALPDMVYFER